MSDPLAFLLTFRTYGTWLHGDARGSVDDDHNAPGTPLLPPDDQRQDSAAEILTHEPLILSDAMRRTVDEAILDECSFRYWELMERAVRTNHIHIVVGFAGTPPELMIQRLKARASRWLRERGLVPRDRTIWSDRPGSRRYLWKPEHIQAACAYVRDGQDVPR
jgi:REP element-mobilizing transposase RayT